jgi:lysozyme
MKPSAKCIAQIKRWEGFREQAYQDQGGRWTLGFGETYIDEGGETRPVREGDTITQQDADTWLRKQLAFVSDFVSKNFPNISQSQLDALTALGYNIGLGNLRGSTLWKLLEAGETGKAADEFMKWSNVHGKPVEALAKRRAVERSWFLAA